MTGLRSHRLRAALLAIGLLLPLLHGAGAHLSRPAAAASGVSARTDAGVPHAADETCTLCVAGRASSGHATAAPAAPSFPAHASGHPTASVGPVAVARHARPDAPRAPPHALA